MRLMRLLCVLIALGLSASVVHANVDVGTSDSCITCLGSFLNVTSPDAYMPHDNFRKVHVSLRQYGLPELLLLTIPHDDQSSVQTWAVAKALTQFGSLRRVKAIEKSCHQITARGTTSMACDLPALDLSRAIYSSRYLRFVYGSAGTYSGRKFHRNRTLPASEAALFQRYACTPARFGCGDPRVRVSDFLEMIDRYEQTASQFLDVSVFRLPVTPGADASTVTPTSNQVRDALATGTEPADGSDLVTYVNAEANIMSALICDADGKRPASVCKRGAIKEILRSVK